MKFKDFERIISTPRMNRYVQATGGDTRKAMTLYRLNLRLSQEFFTVISCLEVALRNAIDGHYQTIHGINWLRDSALPNGMYNQRNCGITPSIISAASRRLTVYSHQKLLAEMDFGFWRYTFGLHQFHAGGQTLLRIFPNKPTSTPQQQYDHTYVFGELEKINMLRNRLAHHEPICFGNGQGVKNTTYARDHYRLAIQFFQWMDIDEKALLYGLDHIVGVCDDIDSL